jgi:hypothetical protein
LAADVNGDNKQELLCADDNLNLTVLTNNGGILVSNSSINIGNNPNQCVLKDINGDGRLDLICGHFGTSSVWVMTNALSFLPRLSFKQSSSNFVLTWPSSWSSWAGWTLQQSSDLNTINWNTFTGPVGDDGIIKTATNSSLSGNVFFRLAHP